MVGSFWNQKYMSYTSSRMNWNDDQVTVSREVPWRVHEPTWTDFRQMMAAASHLDCPSNQRCVAVVICSLDLDRRGRVPEFRSIQQSKVVFQRPTGWCLNAQYRIPPNCLRQIRKRHPIMNWIGAKNNGNQSELDSRETLWRDFFPQLRIPLAGLPNRTALALRLAAEHPTSNVQADHSSLNLRKSENGQSSRNQHWSHLDHQSARRV